jgi:hypothetical protein
LAYPPTPHTPRPQASRLEDLQARVGVAYDPGNASHQESLRELWGIAFPGGRRGRTGRTAAPRTGKRRAPATPAMTRARRDAPAPAPAPAPRSRADTPCPGLKGPEWKEMGWQGVDPSTDFRAAGLLGLDCLTYLGRERPAAFQALLRKSRGARSSWEYPFGAAGMNVTWMLVELLGLRPGGGGSGGSGGASCMPGGAAGCGFAGLLSGHSAAFEEVYCAAFEALDAVWLERRATYMEFNAVLKETRARVSAALAARPGDVGALRRALGLPPDAGAGG